MLQLLNAYTASSFSEDGSNRSDLDEPAIAVLPAKRTSKEARSPSESPNKAPLESSKKPRLESKPDKVVAEAQPEEEMRDQ